MFKVGERVIYSSQGIGVIEAIEDREINGRKIPYYTIKLLKQGSRNLKLMVPVNGSGGMGLHYPIQKEEIPRVLDILSSPEGEELPSDYQERFTVIRRKLERGDAHQLAELIRDLDSIKDLSVSEKSLLEKARRQLIEELSSVQRSPRWEMEEEIEDLLEGRRKACQAKKK